MVSIGSTNPGGVAFTPNEQLVIGWNTIYSLTSTGDLVNGISGPLMDSIQIDPLGRGLLAMSSFSTFSAYTINYNSRTLSLTTTYPLGTGSIFYFAFTPNGKLGFYYSMVLGWLGGSLLLTASLMLSTTQVLNIPDRSIDDLAVSNDSRYLWASAGYIELFSIDTNGMVTDTGNKYYVLNQTGSYAQYQRNTPDGNLAIVEYLDFNLGGSFATAYINGDGSLTWTGYTFAFDSAHPTEGTVVDYAIVPVYATGIPEEFWKDPPPEITIRDSQKILINP